MKSFLPIFYFALTKVIFYRTFSVSIDCNTISYLNRGIIHECNDFTELVTEI